MAYYALGVVPVDWQVEQSFGFSQQGYEKWRDSIEPGTMVLLYKPAPVKAIVAQAEVHALTFLKLEEWPQQNVKQQTVTGMGQQASYILPLRVLFHWSPDSYIPLEIIREYVDNFPVSEWTTINSTIYERLRNWSPNLKTTM